MMANWVHVSAPLLLACLTGCTLGRHAARYCAYRHAVADSCLPCRFSRRLLLSPAATVRPVTLSCFTGSGVLGPAPRLASPRLASDYLFGRERSLK
ncbi:hypothetical protein V8C34DRAFT_265618 [Trichoderma compactum]